MEVVVNLLYFKDYFNFYTAINTNKKEIQVDLKVYNLRI